ncbi:MAG: hypothetical protein F6K28_34095 [Microcoleus sp. SIO2G3]|nr:hypothetical protein [Microcoleus sp. SIO2G3]
MHLIGLLIGSSTVLGVGYFCIDLYRNRSRLSVKPKPPAGIFCFDTLPSPEDNQVQAVGHAIEEASRCASEGVGHCVEAIAHTLSHH